MSDFALETHALTKSFGDVHAVAGIDLAVPRGSFYGFLGPNGAGKSTTIKCLTGLLEPSGGEIRLLGLDPRTDPLAVKRQVGVVPEDLGLFEQITGAETLRFVGEVHGIERSVLEERTAELLKLMSLEDAASSPVADYSHGMRKKIALATAILPAPRLLFLDEPFEGIDAVASRLMRRLLENFVARGGTIFLTSHILEIVERLCDHLGVISQGRLVAQGSVGELRSGGEDGRTLEELFLDLIGAEADDVPDLPWLTT